MSYADYGGFGPAYFGAADPVHPAGYTDYRPGLFDWSTLASEISGQGSDPVIVVGCAYGFVLDELPNGWDAAGMDISPHAVAEATDRGHTVIEGDATNATDVKSLRNEVQGKPRRGITECLLSCLTDAEAVSVAENLRSEARDVMHFVWTDPNPEYYNAKSLAEWQALVDPDGNDDWVDFNTLYDYWPHQ